MKTILNNIQTTVLLLTIIMSSCAKTEKNDVFTIKFSEYPNLKEMQIDVDILDFQPCNIFYSDFFSDWDTASIKIITHIDTECTSCINEVKDWNTFILENQEIFKNIPVIFIASGLQSDYFDFFINKPTILTPVFLDINDHFISKNSLYDLLHERTIIIDKSNKIKTIGSPIFDPKLRSPFLNVIKQLKYEL